LVFFIPSAQFSGPEKINSDGPWIMPAIRKCRSLTLMPLLFGCMAWVGAAPTPKALTGRIVFEHAPDDSAPWPTTDIYSVNADGTELRALTNDGHSYGPSWSADGRYILYIHDTTWPSHLPAQHLRIDDKKWLSHAFSELYVMDSDGENAHLFRQLDGRVQAAALSPDGKTLAFDGVEPGADGESVLGFFLIPVPGQGKPHRLFRVPSGPAWWGQAWGPAWSPDGKKVAFAVQAPKNVYDGDLAIVVADADGSHQIEVTNPDHIQGAYSPAWSPDGRQIAFDAFAGRNNRQQIFVMHADGSNIRQLTSDTQWQCWHPTWSPDGNEMAFCCRPETAPCPSGGNDRRGCVRRIFVMSLTDPNAKPIQITQHDGANPVFAPVE
jgi:Tol biopolymer transport system component